MKLLKTSFLAAAFIGLSCTAGFSATPVNCLSYNDCDMVVACALVGDVRNAIAGGIPDYNATVADAIRSKEACRNYPDDFKRDVDAIIYNNPTVRLTINWDTVRNAVRTERTAFPAAEKLSDELDSLLPWYGILVVKKGSLDKYANAEVPIISSEYMKRNRDQFYPGNSDKPLGAWRGCTHSNHTAHDNDVVNRAAHVAFKEDDSFWSGNDYYVYDGKDVYWGTAQLIGEIALAILTFGISAEVSAARAATQATVATAKSIQAISKSVTSVKLVRDAAKIQKAVSLAEAAKAGSAAAAVASRADAIAALADAGVKVNKGVRAAQLVKIGGVLKNTATTAKPLHWVSSLARPHRLIRTGMQTLKPKNIIGLYGRGVTWGQRFKRAAITAAGVGVGASIGTALIKAYGYSTAAIENYAEGVSFNSFGLLSADNLENRENEISHGAWIMFEEGGTKEDDDTLNEALAVAEDFQESMNKINAEDPQCDVDIYVVQPGIGNPNNKSIGKREIYYLIQNPSGSLRINLPAK